NRGKAKHEGRLTTEAQRHREDKRESREGLQAPARRLGAPTLLTLFCLLCVSVPLWFTFLAETPGGVVRGRRWAHPGGRRTMPADLSAVPGRVQRHGLSGSITPGGVTLPAGAHRRLAP